VPAPIVIVITPTNSTAAPSYASGVMVIPASALPRGQAACTPVHHHLLHAATLASGEPHTRHVCPVIYYMAHHHKFSAISEGEFLLRETTYRKVRAAQRQSVPDTDIIAILDLTSYHVRQALYSTPSIILVARYALV